MKEEELLELKDAYDKAAIKCGALKNELYMMKMPILMVGTHLAPAPEPSFPKEEEEIKAAEKELDKASTAYFDKIKERRREY